VNYIIVACYSLRRLTFFGKKIAWYTKKAIMQVKYIAVLLIAVWLLAASCSKKQQPQGTAAASKSEATRPPAKIKVVKRMDHPPLPKVLTIDDRAAKKAVDGRLYYDLEGKRYWRNYDDGKYYQYNQTMYNLPAFKPH
jgi:hypothetical protein